MEEEPRADTIESKILAIVRILADEGNRFTPYDTTKRYVKEHHLRDVSYRPSEGKFRALYARTCQVFSTLKSMNKLKKVGTEEMPGRKDKIFYSYKE